MQAAVESGPERARSLRSARFPATSQVKKRPLVENKAGCSHLKKSGQQSAWSCALFGKRKNESGAFPRLALRDDLSPVGLHDVLHDRQSQAGSAEVARTGPVDPVKTLEDPGEIFLRNADPAVLDFDFDPALFLGSLNLDRSLFRGVFDGVLQQINKNLIDFFRIGPELHFRGNGERADLLFFLRERREQEEIFFKAFFQRNLRRPDRVEARLDPGEVEKVLNDILEPVAVFLQDR